MAFVLVASAATGLATDEDPPNYVTSPFHGAIDGDGRKIPCRCRFGGQDFRLGETVCMQTHVGTVMARCDLLLNNTSWIPTKTPCQVSDRSVPSSYQFAANGVLSPE